MLVVAAAVLLLWRRLDGAVDRPLSAGGLAAAGLTLVAMAAAARPLRLPAKILLGLGAIGVAAALSVPGSSAAGLAVLWTLVVVGHCWILARPCRGRSPAGGSQCEVLLQEFTRRRATDGAEELSGRLLLPLEPGQRAGNMHVAFCPPFETVPEVAVRQVGGPAARIKAAQVLPHGARLEVKLSAAAERCDEGVLVEFYARVNGPSPPGEG